MKNLAIICMHLFLSNLVFGDDTRSKDVSVRRTPSSEIFTQGASCVHERKNDTWKRTSQGFAQALKSGMRW